MWPRNRLRRAGARAEGNPVGAGRGLQRPERAGLVRIAVVIGPLVATVNSDDPAYFGGYMNRNFIEAFEALPKLTARHAYQLAANSFEASFVGARQKRQWRDQLDAVFGLRH